MATWKESGEVPDSEDDEDLESLSSYSPEQRHDDDSRIDEDKRLDDPVSTSEAEPELASGGNNGDRTLEKTFEAGETARDLELPGSSVASTLKARLSSSLDDPSEKDRDNLLESGSAEGEEEGGNSADLELPEISLLTPKARSALSPEPNVTPLPLAFLQNSDLSPSWFRLLDEDHSETERQVGDGNLNVPIRLDEPLHSEEVSKSYVQITSAASSPPSASLPSLSSLLESRPSVGGFVSQTSSKKRKVSVNQEEEPVTSFAKRTFRGRTKRQLHPYQYEQMAYDRTLRERGLKPIKIVESEERSLASLSTDSHLLDSQNLDSQEGFIVTEESQETDHLVENSSPPRKSKTALQSQDLDEVMNHAGPMNSDDDLPPVEDLVQKPKSKSQFTKRISKTYSTKGKRPPPSALQIAQISSPQSQRPSSVFDVRTSPPLRSSPFPDYDRGQISRTTSTSSALPTPRSRAGGHRVDEKQSSTITKKAPSAPILIDPDADSENDEAAQQVSRNASDSEDASDASAASNSSSNESAEIRRGGKKIRGVLPASHLRLDSRKIKQHVTPFQARQVSRSVSPTDNPLRRGIALPTMRRRTQNASMPSNADMAFLEGISDDEEDELLDMTTQTQRTGLSSLFAQSRVGDAEEEDSIDLMLPSQKRHRTKMNGPLKKRKIGHSGQGKQEGLQRQPRITEHLDHPRTSKLLPRKRVIHSRKRRRGVVKESTPPPRLGILDVTDTLVDRSLPLFIRVAARTSRAKKSQGRQSPTNKFIRLANREDTTDARSVLQEWRNGTIRQKDSMGVRRGPRQASGSGTGGVDSGEQTTLQPPVKKARLQQVEVVRRTGIPNKLANSDGAQQSMNDFVLHQDSESDIPNLLPQQTKERQHSNQLKKRQIGAARSRPAQLESLQAPGSDLLPVPKFRYVKGTLDLSYRLARKQALLQANVPLRRFIDDKDLPRSAEATSIDTGAIDLPLQSIEPFPNTIRRKKTQPRRLDVGAAEYRQPNAPLVLDFLAPAVVQDQGISTKLLNLGKYGTNYPTNFDIFPLPPGVFFQDTTFIGSGCLAESLKDVDREWCRLSFHGPPNVLSLGAKEFHWGKWTDEVSSEVGICFDWIVEQHFAQTSDIPSQPAAKTVDVLHSVCVYAQSVSFIDAHSLHEFVSRMKEVLDDFLCRMTKEASPAYSAQATYVALMEKCLLLCLRLLSLSRTAPDLSSLIFGLEHTLQKFASACVKVLFALGLEKVRKLYDNLQYVSIRDRGIGSDDFETEAWVVILKVLNKARIPKGSFMDVVNSVLLAPEVRNTQDARIMEKMWYSLFSLLPLSEFDDFGFVIQGSRHAAAFDNWALPQQMLKRVFELYKLNQRQSPSFNDYCRSIVSRCHCLMVEWGWWKCNGVIGTLFDFFASQNLAHLRNEEVHKSPHFLEELHLSPSLAIEAEDRCFHIFLKIAALRLKHFGEVDNEKGARNLVARLLPNHDRQYPKEQKILERDFASLRNHHDLLCTLFFSAPPQHRPAPALIQALVNPSRSHTQAILLNIRSWQRLTDFVLATDPTYEGYHSLAAWQHALLGDLLTQYDNIETEIRSQAAMSSSVFTEAEVTTTVLTNQAETMQSIEQMLIAINGTTPAGPRRVILSLARDRVDIVNLSRVLRHNPAHGQLSVNMVEIIRQYAKVVVTSAEESEMEESQELAELVMDRFDAAENLATIIVPLRQWIRTAIAGPSLVPNGYEPYMKCWAQLVHLFVEVPVEGYKLSDLVGPGQHSLFDHTLAMPDEKHHLWSVFLHEVLQCCNWKKLMTPHLDVGTELLKSLLRPATAIQETDSIQLSHDLYTQKYCLLRGEIAGNGNIPQSRRERASVIIDRRMLSILSSSRRADSAVEYFKAQRLPSTTKDTLKWCLTSMETIVKEGVPTRGSSLNSKAAGILFKRQIGDALRFVEIQLKGMAKDIANLPAHRDYVQHLQVLMSMIKLHTRKFATLPDFFTKVSIDYWPSENDPGMFIDIATAHALEFEARRTLGNVTTFLYFLLMTFDQAIEKNKLSAHYEHVKTVMMDTPEFVTFVIDELARPILETSTSHGAGWVLLGVYYIPLAEALACAMDGKTINNTSALSWVLANKLLAMIMRAMRAFMRDDVRAFKDATPGRMFYREERILAILVAFWSKLSPAMERFSSRNPRGSTDNDHLKEYNEFFPHLVYLAPDNKCQGRAPRFSNGPRHAMAPNEFWYEQITKFLSDHVSGWNAPSSGNEISFKMRKPTDRDRPGKATVPALMFKDVIEREEGRGKYRTLIGGRDMLQRKISTIVPGVMAGAIATALRKLKKDDGGENARGDELDWEYGVAPTPQ